MVNRFVISAYHNYLVNGSLVAGFHLGKSGKDQFFFRAPPLQPETAEPQPLISAYLFSRTGQPFVEIDNGLVVRNPGGLGFKKTKKGLSIQTPDGSPFFSYETLAFKNSYYTRFAGTLYDEHGVLMASGAWKDFVTHGNAPAFHPVEPT